jgi:tetratricopeptide (TPR) repeat protein
MSAAAALALAAALAPSPRPIDAKYREALELLYDGSTDTAIERLSSLAAEAPDDPMGAYLAALALCWKIEQRPESRALEGEFQGRVDRTIAMADARLAADPRDVRALLARGAAHGVRSRLHLFRAERRGAAQEAVRMREDLLDAHRLAPCDQDALFGLGLYDYYADVLPRLLKLVRFVFGIPGGNRARGLARIASARDAPFHHTEVRWQLYEIYAFYEDDPERAWSEMAGLHRAYPDAPLWGLKLAEHLRERLGLLAESAAAAREVLAAAEGGHPNFSPVVAAMARLSLGETLLRDLRLSDAADALHAAADAPVEASAVATRARFFLGRALELSGRRADALPHYRAAARAADPDLRSRAGSALASPIPEAERAGSLRLAEARRLREAGRAREASEAYREALRLWPACREAALRVAEEDLDAGHVPDARRLLRRAEGGGEADLPWLRPLARLLLARAHDAAGERNEAEALYKDVLKKPCGQGDLRAAASEGLRRPWVPPDGSAAPPRSLDHSR